MPIVVTEFRKTDGQVDLRNVAAIGGKSEALEEVLRSRFREGMSLDEAVALGVDAFREAEGRESEGWEAAVLESANGRRTFRRIEVD